MEYPRHGRRRKIVSEEKRERDVFLLYGAVFRDIPHLEACLMPANHVARPSPDSTLTALAQLCTLRLGVGRAMISLIDDKRQYIIAEATPAVSLRPEAPSDSFSTLWLGSVSIPRQCGMCEKVLDVGLPKFDSDEIPALVIEDLKESQDDINQSYIRGTGVRFYAAAPLISPAGAIVGSLSIMDNEPRPDGLTKEQQRSLRDIAESVLDYLHNYTIKDQYRRGERFTRGLISFSEGAADLIPFKNISLHDEEESRSDVSSSEVASPFEERGDPLLARRHISRAAAPLTQRLKDNRQRSMQKLQETVLPLDSRSMFTRAASVMMESSVLDGVIILDASVAANSSHQQTNSNSERATESSGGFSKTSSSDDGHNSEGNDRGQRPNMCHVLGSAISDHASNEPNGLSSVHGSLTETDLARMLHDFPQGKVITFGVDGLALSSTEESGGSSGTSQKSTSSPPKRKESRGNRHVAALLEMLPGARSVAFIPFWDYERGRWFAGCICWTNSAHRLLSAAVDLAYFKVFSHSIMRELSRLDALASNQAKTTFVASISHELRSPLHGILGTLEFIKDTPLDSFQSSMLNSLSACSQTLLDTINHVMDYAKIREARKSVSSKKLKSANTVRLSSKPLKSRRSKFGSFDLGIATEEVVEAVFSGSSYVPVSDARLEASNSGSDIASEPPPKRKMCYIILDLAYDEDWIYSFPIGSWRRIVMNLFGNAVKYTESGHILVSLRVNEGSKVTAAPTVVTLTITDSGAGMGQKFLANKAFQPFSQENSFAPGTGLGLNIVKTIIETNGGKIEVNSSPSVGTKLTVKLALTKPEIAPIIPPQRNEFCTFLPRLEGRRICVLQRHMASSSEKTDLSPSEEGLVRFTNSLATTLSAHLKMDVVRTAKWEGHDADIVILPEVSFEYLDAIRRARPEGGRAPVTVFIAMDALEAATLRSDVRVQRRESVVEIMTQPCGPYKLAYMLDKCLDRFALPEENLQRQSSGTQSSHLTFANTRSQRLPDPPLSLLESLEPAITEAPYIESQPAADSAPATTPTDSRITLPLRHTPPASQILIVDDNVINRRLLVAFMNKYNYHYQEAENGLQALDAYRKDPPRFKVVLMDMSMPIMDGMTSTRAIRQHEEENSIPRCRIVALTGLASATARLEALSSGVDHFMTKPVNFKALSELMRKEDDRRRIIDEKDVRQESEEKEEGESVHRPESLEGVHAKEETKEPEEREGEKVEGTLRVGDVSKTDEVLQEEKEPKADEVSKREETSKGQESTNHIDRGPTQHEHISPSKQPSKVHWTSQEPDTSTAGAEAPNEIPLREKAEHGESSPTHHGQTEHPPHINNLEETSPQTAEQTHHPIS